VRSNEAETAGDQKHGRPPLAIPIRRARRISCKAKQLVLYIQIA
jgi:hypothetical protein